MNFAILDGVVVAVVLISAILAMFRGFVREVLSIAAWVAAAVLAYAFYAQLTPYVSEYVNNRALAVGLSAAAIFLVSLIIVSVITMKISDFVMDSPVGVLDRLLGFVFGAARGLLLLVVAVIFFNWLVDEPNRPAWVTTAQSYPELSRLGDRLIAAIPDDPEAAIRGAFETPGETVPATSTPPAPATQPTPNVAPPPAVGQNPQNPEELNRLLDTTGDSDEQDAPEEPATGATPGAPVTPVTPEITETPAAPENTGAQ
jgi:membrane protein required for colicin V production